MKKKLYYPLYDEKISKHLIKNDFNNNYNMIKKYFNQFQSN